MRRLFTVLLPLCMAAFAAHSVRPQAGVDVDETVTVATPPQPPKSCIALPIGHVQVLLDRDRIEKLGSSAPKAFQTDADRDAMLASDRAARILAAIGRNANSLGCSVVDVDSKSDTLYLVFHHLEQGQAAVFDAKTGHSSKAVVIRYLGQRCGPRCGGGHFTVRRQEENSPFLVLEWWIA